MRRRNELSTEELSKVNGLMTADDFTLDELLDLFIHECKIKDLREVTQQYYRNEIHAYANILREQGIDPHPAHVTNDTITEHIVLYCKDVKGIKPVSINTRLRALKVFFNFLEKKQYINKNPMQAIVQIKHRNRIIPTFTTRQVNTLLGKPDLKTFTGIRDVTIMMMMLEIGIRVNELSYLDTYDVKMDESMVLIRKSKGYNERALPIQSEMREQLRKYFRIRGNVATDALFVTIDGDRLSKRQIQNRIIKYGSEANLKGVRCSPHTFRHTFAKMSVQNGANIFDLQFMLGHTSMEMVRRYVNLFGNDVKATHRQFSPLKNLHRNRY